MKEMGGKDEEKIRGEIKKGKEREEKRVGMSQRKETNEREKR